VRDYGVGLRPGEADLVFNRFWRADPSRNRRTGGTGLGLAISVEDAHLHGGTLEAWGEPGKGACFRLTLPRQPNTEVTDSPLPLCPDDAPVDDVPMVDVPEQESAEVNGWHPAGVVPIHEHPVDDMASAPAGTSAQKGDPS
jgi:two-component system, OmpR family, sensor histidine kinase MtrB